jgi:hypothetical protein
MNRERENYWAPDPRTQCEISKYMDAYFWKLTLPFKNGLSGAKDSCRVTVEAKHGMGWAAVKPDAKAWVSNLAEEFREELDYAIDAALIKTLEDPAGKIKDALRYMHGKIASSSHFQGSSLIPAFRSHPATVMQRVIQSLDEEGFVEIDALGWNCTFRQCVTEFRMVAEKYPACPGSEQEWQEAMEIMQKISVWDGKSRYLI